MKNLLLYILTFYSTLTLGQQTVLGEKGIIEPELQKYYCHRIISEMTFPLVEIKGDTVISLYAHGPTYFVNDSTEIFGSYQSWKHCIVFNCDTIRGCEFWVVCNDKDDLKNKRLVVQKPLSDPKYILDGFGYGIYDRQIRMILEKKTNHNTNHQK
ncbi:MAG: hypothetical protein JKX84_08570 [Flavobacteriales bacterium]|nr:hypothetical protein [Flavobacteriales bacterium]